MRAANQCRRLIHCAYFIRCDASKHKLSKAFDRRFGMTPMLFRELNCRGSGATAAAEPD
jgi:hypothetical protein